MHFAKSVPATRGGEDRSDGPAGDSPDSRADRPPAPVTAVSCGDPWLLGQLRLAPRLMRAPALEWGTNVRLLRNLQAACRRVVVGALATAVVQSPLREMVW